LGDYNTIRKELKSYNPKLSKKNEVILITKVDLIDSKSLEKLKKLFKNKSKKVLPISIYDWEGIEKLKRILMG
jgi:GTPase involved in cell partitioning and DNA repair